MDRRPLGRLALSAVVIGVVTGVVFGLIKGSVWSGLLHGVVYGVGLTIVSYMVDRSTAMEKLSFRQRRTVRRKLRDGEGTDDPELASALIEHGSQILSNPVVPRQAGIAAGVMFAFGVTASVLGLARMGGPGIAVGLLLVMLSLVTASMVVTQSEHRRELVAQSVRATDELVHKG